MSSRVALFLSLTVIIIHLPGCGPATRTVSGNVTVDGQPLNDATITFVPLEGVTGGSRVWSIQNGSFSLNLPVGKYRVELNARGRIVPGQEPGGRQIREVITPPKYNTESTIVADVLADGDNKLTYEIKSPAGVEVAAGRGREARFQTGNNAPVRDNTPDSNTTREPRTPGPGTSYVPQPFSPPPEDPIVASVVITCQVTALLVFVAALAGAISLMMSRTRPAAKPRSDEAGAEQPVQPTVPRNLAIQWGRVALLVAVAAGLLAAAEMMRLAVRMEQMGARLEQKLDNLSGTR